MKKLAKFMLPLLFTVALISGCGSNAPANTSGNASADGSQPANSATAGGNAQTDKAAEPADTGYVPETLTVQFVPSQNADTLEAKAKPLEKLLSDRLGIPVKVSVSTDYNTIIEAMASKQVDVGFLPPTAYVLAKEKGAAEVILQAQRYGVDDATGAPTNELVDFYKSMFIVKKDSPIQSVEDLKGKKIAYQNVTSSAGYVWPAAVLQEKGIDPLSDVEPITVKGHDQAVIAVLNGDVDAAAIFQDARNTVKKDYPNVFEDTRVIAYTEPIPNDTISVRSDMSAEWVQKLKDAFIEIGKDSEGHKIIADIYTHEGYVESNDSVFDIVREYNEKVKTE
ncbi:phosphate/phosphite/phosphonate ABC transporter substrate-binding protein [Paenibacillus macerans]|uniref:Phosphate/phosphite/phosphonate ABC transporter substrate-binding protein n=1 Tax=Paenibacillus macerans TaxID=44252 RepID=A0A090Y6X5_PAEMA|nr:phosphate/phosphite/phosphonate ABC transporter substrate-binding protein [Paenibacillus macerans]KFM94224.1 phosphate/phosphite/phosphonate ABC transporter, periplasmic binding family protein [Paenibacillus macerans]MCY7561817.1 phosphate/phosphite/phosphonate ABC transporter substrate-binding protein [Paenibacillus macerans]MEC0139620.1 phosphate/phosphite/phosphonate ABC transporter substrate-binding protein [Paenibacillus macerans]MEC0149720.1 phosphate/phosphite/phosphonate ABC transpor